VCFFFVVVQEFLHSHIRAEDTEFYLSPDALQVQQILSQLSLFFFTMCVVWWTVWAHHLPHMHIHPSSRLKWLRNFVFLVTWQADVEEATPASVRMWGIPGMQVQIS
jgi:hypothetical protein